MLDLVSHTRSAHPVLNIKCEIDQCDKQVNKADSAWYRHVRIHHSHHYNNTQIVASATTTGHSEPLAEGGASDRGTETPTSFTVSGFEDTTPQLFDDSDINSFEPLPVLESNLHSGGHREVANMILNLKDKQTPTGCTK